MIKSLLSRIRGYSRITREFYSEKSVFENLLEAFAADMGVNIVFTDLNGRFIFEKLVDDFYLDNKFGEECGILNSRLNEQFKGVVDTISNIGGEKFFITTAEKDVVGEYVFSVSPVTALSKRLGTIIAYKRGDKFDEECMTVFELVVTWTALAYLHIKTEEEYAERMKQGVVKSAIGTLSYSELEAVIHIFDVLDDKEGFLVASKVADEVGITRSVIVNALRKLESAGVVESRSLGMKGTYIKVLNEFFLEEIDKLK